MEKSKYKSLSEWRKNELNAYNAAYSKGLIPKICKLFNWMEMDVKNPKKPGEWTFDKCLESASKYAKKTDWYKNENRAYHAANRNGWIYKCCMHMPNTKKENNYWTKEKCIEEAFKYNTVKEWSKKSGSSYSIAKVKNWYAECSKHMNRLIKDSGYWTLEACQKEALKYSTIREWEIKDKTSYSIARTKGLFNKCISHMKVLRKPSRYWTFESCFKSASNFNTKKQWSKVDGGAYAASLKKGWFTECTKHMIEVKKHKGYWNMDRCKEDALKYTSKTEWKKKSSSAYSICCNNKWASECCKHMIDLRGKKKL